MESASLPASVSLTDLPYELPSDAEKQAVVDAFEAGRPTRVPMILGNNVRVVLMSPDWNPEGITFQQYMEDPETHVKIALRHQLYQRQVLGKVSDIRCEPPEVWQAPLMVFNIYEAASLGAPVKYFDQQVPDTQVCLTDDNRESIFEVDIDNPLDLPFHKKYLAFEQQMQKIVKDMTFEGRPVQVPPWSQMGTDGPVTVAMNLRGPEFMMDLIEDPDYADRLMAFLIRAALRRRQAFARKVGSKGSAHMGIADDSCAMLSEAMYRQQVLPHHRTWYEAEPKAVRRGLHMCGDATHLFPTIHQQLNVTAFDTGFPVDFADLREKLGPEVRIQGGPEVALLVSGTPYRIYQRTRDILRSGVMAGGRFILREGNNLPPNVPLENLAAMYQANLEFGQYPS